MPRAKKPMTQTRAMITATKPVAAINTVGAVLAGVASPDR